MASREREQKNPQCKTRSAYRTDNDDKRKKENT